MKPHLEKAHQFWKDHLQSNDHVIDATCGNGKDTAVLAGIVTDGHVYAIDIQEVALEKARGYVKGGNVIFLRQCHSKMPDCKGVRLVVYNLGYLPGGDKGLTSRVETTLESVARALELLPVGGALSIMCYPGHEEGAREEKALEAWAKTVGHEVQWYRWREGSPTLLIVIKVNILV